MRSADAKGSSQFNCPREHDVFTRFEPTTHLGSRRTGIAALPIDARTANGLSSRVRTFRHSRGKSSCDAGLASWQLRATIAFSLRQEHLCWASKSVRLQGLASSFSAKVIARLISARGSLGECN